MKARCIDSGSSNILKIGKVYDVEECSHLYYLVSVFQYGDKQRYSYYKDLFEIIKDIELQSGSIRCKCGTITTNNKYCCDCLKK